MVMTVFIAKYIFYSPTISTRILIHSFDISDVNIKTPMLLCSQLQSSILTTHKMQSKIEKDDEKRVKR